MDTQLPLPFAIAQDALTEFLEKYTALEAEMDRLREEIVRLKGVYEDALPLRAVLTAVKVVRVRRKLEQHPKEGMGLPHQVYLEGLVADHYAAQDAALAQLEAEAGA